MNPDNRFHRYLPTNLDLVTTASAVLNSQALVRSANAPKICTPVGGIGPAVAHAFDAATTSGGVSGNVTSGTLAVAMEIEARDDVSATWTAKWEVGEGLRLAARTIVFGGRSVNLFVVQRPRTVDRYRARALRIHVLRLHSEREYLRRVARLLAVEGFLDRCEYPQTERLQTALNESLKVLTRANSHGFATPEITAAFVADRTLSGAELEVLMERVQGFRPVISRRLQRLQELDDSAEAQWRSLLERDLEGKNFVYVREAHMTQYDQRGSQIGAAGDNATASNFGFGSQLNLGTLSPSQTEALKSAIYVLRKHLADRLLSDSATDVEGAEVSPTQIGEAIGMLSEAEDAIAAKDEQRALSALGRCGRWLASFAQGVGVEIAAAAIRAALRLP